MRRSPFLSHCVAEVSATALAAIPHLLWGWQERAVVVAPALAGVGTALVASVTLLARRRAWSVARGTVAATVAPIVAVLGVQAVAPGVLARFGERLAVLFACGHIDEAQSLVDPVSLVTLRPLSHFGVLLLWGVPALVFLWVRAVRRGNLDWLVLVTVGGVLGGLATVQLRFAGEWSVALPIIAAVGLLEPFSRMELCASPLDERRQRLSAPAPGGVLIPCWCWRLASSSRSTRRAR